MFTKIITPLLNLIFPIECLACRKENTYLCLSCLDKIKLADQGQPFDHQLKHLDRALWVASYEDKIVRQAIHCLKFRYIKELAKPLTELMIRCYQNLNFKDFNPLIIPVPLHKKRLLERGFNQTELLAKNLSDYFNLPLADEVVIKKKITPHQVGLSKKQRLTNVKDSFEVIKPEIIKNQQILLIDDVITTGSTLEEMARVLKEKGAKEVWGLVVAKD